MRSPAACGFIQAPPATPPRPSQCATPLLQSRAADGSETGQGTQILQATKTATATLIVCCRISAAREASHVINETVMYGSGGAPVAV